MMVPVRLPRVSTRAVELLKAAPEKGQEQPEPVPEVEPPSDSAALVDVISKIAARDSSGLLSQGAQDGGAPASLSQLQSAVLSGECTLPQLAAQFRVLCDHAIAGHFYTNRQLAQEASDLLDFGNSLLHELEEPGGLGRSRHVAAEQQQQQQREGAPTAAQQLPDESFFFLPASQLKDCLVVAVDESLAARGRSRRAVQQQQRPYYGEHADSEGGAGGRASRAPAGKRRKVEGGGQQAGARRRGRKQADPWTPELQGQLAMVLGVVLQPSEGSERVLPSLPQVQELQALTAQLLSSQAAEQMRAMGAMLAKPRATLHVGGYLEPEELMADVMVECREAAEVHLAVENPGVRRGKVTGAAEGFVALLASSLEAALASLRAALAASGGGGGGREDAEEDAAVYMPDLPPSIAANKEPYRHGDWRKTPFVPRPYVRLSDYDVVEPALSGAVIAKKLATRKAGGCSGEHCSTREELGCFSIEHESFDTQCPCLKRNTECDAHCACHGGGACLNRAVSERRTLQLGVDVREIDSWGIDCYTRRNIHDAVLESQAFGPYVSPHQPAQQQRHAAAAAPAVASAPVAAAAPLPAAAVAAAPLPVAAAAAPAMEAVPSGTGAGGESSRSDSGATEASHLGHLSLGAAAAAGAPAPAQQQQQQQQQQGQQPLAEQQAAPLAEAASVAVPMSDADMGPAGGAVAAEGPGGSELQPQQAQQPVQVPAQEQGQGQGQQQALSQEELDQRVTNWIERTLLPAVNRQGEGGWDILRALAAVKGDAQASGDGASFQAASAVEERVNQVGYNYFRVHPKGTGLQCVREGGLPPLTFVEEYFGEIHQPWRWFEIQDAVKRITGDELPDFYNIVLERPKDDPDGYDVLFIDAAAKGAFASRMSHSCTPNCQAVVMACSGRLTIALYTLRHVYPGEELTFDYASVTESEKEFKEAICLCSTHLCRGSYLMFTGSRAFMQIMSSRHNFLHRQAIIARAGTEPLTESDLARLDAHGLRSCCLGGGSHGHRLPDWLLKWAALVCEFMELEEACLQQELLAHPLGIYNEATAAVEAKGVVSNRLQNVVITLDKVKMVLGAKAGQPMGPCLRLLDEQEVVEHLWSGPKSIARRALKGCISLLALAAHSRELLAASSDEEWQAALAAAEAQLPQGLPALVRLGLQPAGSAEEACAGLLQLVSAIRALDMARGGGLTACADILTLYASTKHWITAERCYKAVVSPPVPLNLADLNLDRTKGQQQQQQGQGQGGGQQQQQGEGGGGGGAGAARLGSRASLASLGAESGGEGAAGEAAAAPAASNLGSSNAAAANSNLRKSYRPLYVWGQLSGWFKQTVADPTASLSAERRGTLSLPDVESCFGGGKGKYGPKERADMLEQIERRPDAMWRIGTQWSFKNEAKVYGSPMLDSVWDAMAGLPGGGLDVVLQQLKAAEVPFRGGAAAWGEEGGGGSGRAAKKRGKAQQ